MTDLAQWQAAVKVWPAVLSRDPELGGVVLTQQMAITRAFVAQHLVKSEAAQVCLSTLKVLSEAIAGRWVSQTAVLSSCIAAGFEISKGRRGAIFVRCCPRHLWLLRALRRGQVPPHHELEAAR